MKNYFNKAANTISRSTNIAALMTRINQPYKVTKVFTQGANSNDSEHLHSLELHDSIRWKNSPTFKKLIQRGRNVNLREPPRGETPLHVAVTVKSILMVHTLLMLSAEVDAVDIDGRTPLHLAAETGQTEIAKLLLLLESDSEIIDNIGHTPLVRAIANNHVYMVRSLLSNSPNITKENIKKAITYAVDNNCKEAIKELSHAEKSRELLEIFLIDKLQFAVSNGNIDLMKRLFEMKVDVDYSYRSEEYPIPILHLALLANTFNYTCNKSNASNISNNNFDEHGHQRLTELYKMNVVHLLIKKGANVNAKDGDGNTALHLAIKQQYFNITKLLLKWKADINVRGKGRKSCLHIAIETNNIPIIELLVQRNCNLNLVDDAGLPPIVMPIMNNDTNVLQILLKGGADVVTIPESVEYAIDLGFRDVINTLYKNKANTELLSKLLKDKLYYSVYDGNMDRVQLLLDVGAEVLYDNTTVTPILTAALLSNTNDSSEMTKKQILEKLIDSGADVNAKFNRTGKSPLYYAIVKKHGALAKLLLDRGANVNNADNGNGSLLHVASSAEDMTMVRLLVENGYKTNVNDYGNHPSVINAILDNNSEQLKLLINTGIDFVAATPYIKYAIDMKFHEVLRILFEHGADPAFIMPPLHSAIINDDEETIKFLLSICADFAALKKNWFPIFAALSCSKNVEQHCEHILQCGFDVNAEYMNGDTLLHYAATNNLIDIARVIIKYGCNLNALNKENRSPLHNAIVHNHAEVVKILMLAGARFDDIEESLKIAIKRRSLDALKTFFQYARDKKLLTELFYNVAYMIDMENVLFLLSIGAKVNALNKKGIPILNVIIASDIGQFESSNVKLLSASMAYPQCVKSSNIETNFSTTQKYHLIRYLISKGANVNAKDLDGISALHLAVEKGYENIASLLIHKRSKVNATSNTGLTPLHVAVVNERITIMKELIKFGANINVRDKQGNTLLHYAAKSEATESAKLLLNLGFDVNTVNKHKCTALFLAVMKGRDKMVEMLLNWGIKQKLMQNSKSSSYIK